ncbi:MAG: HD domain-containing protein [Bacteroidales bacterium]|nr:HD domain-containing protein [Bacteroidales bacterium]
MQTNKRKIINDPVYGFMTLDNDILYDIISHPYFLRLQRIKQLGLSYLVYPGAVHNRFSHTLGATYLMGLAIDVLKCKNVEITDHEALSAKIAILLHDIGHGPFSHSLEHTLITDISHEDISKIFMQKMNKEFGGALDTAIAIFENSYHKHFLHQLVSSQLDVDRLDYLARDSFFTGVSEGIIGTERIINMLNVTDDNLVVDEKGIYSIEKFIISRRLMYWQVYLHKTVVSADCIMITALKRAKYLLQNDHKIECSAPLKKFLANDYTYNDFEQNEEILELFSMLDDYDIISAVKAWKYSDDFILSKLSQKLIDRKLNRIYISDTEFEPSTIDQCTKQIAQKYNISVDDASWFVTSGKLENHAYDFQDQEIKILFKDKHSSDISIASDQLDRHFLEKSVTKHFLCFPKELNINL